MRLVSCCDRWLESNATCPLCRTAVSREGREEQERERQREQEQERLDREEREDRERQQQQQQQQQQQRLYGTECDMPEGINPSGQANSGHIIDIV